MQNSSTVGVHVCIHFKKKFAVRKFERCRFNIDADVCNLLSYDGTNYFGSWEIANRHLFFGSEFTANFCENFSGPGSENFDFCCWATPIITTSMPMFATSRAKVEHIILFVRIVSRYFGIYNNFFWQFCENQGRENLSVWENFLLAFNTVTSVYGWLIKNLFWLVNQTCH